MNFPVPVAGMVIAYSFLWVNEAREGHAEGRKYELQLRTLRAPGAKSGGISPEAFGCTDTVAVWPPRTGPQRVGRGHFPGSVRLHGNRGRIAPEDWPPTRRKGAFPRKRSAARKTVAV